MSNKYISMNKSIILLLVVIITLIVKVEGQQNPNYSQFTMNKFILNPAVAGIEGFTTVSLFAREQSLGFSGTPKTHSLSIDSRILGNSHILKKFSIRKEKPEKTRSGNTGWGAYLYNDIYGPISKTAVSGSYSYHIDLGEARLSFGLALLFMQLKINSDDMILSGNELEQYDPLINDETIWITDANFGIYYTSNSFYAGYSSLQLLNSVAQFGEKGQGEYTLNRYHNIMLGYKFFASNRIELEPETLLMVEENLRAQLNFSLKGTYDDKYWGGLSFKTGSSLSVFGGITFDRYLFGYTFEHAFGELGRLSYGSHEIIISARFGDSARRFKWLNTY